MQLYTIIMRAMHTMVPTWAISGVHVVRNDIRRHLPDELLSRLLYSVPVHVMVGQMTPDRVEMEYNRDLGRPKTDSPVDVVIETSGLVPFGGAAHAVVQDTQLWSASVSSFTFLDSMNPERGHRGAAASRALTMPSDGSLSLHFMVTIDRLPGDADSIPSRRYPIYNCRILDGSDGTVSAMSYRVRSALPPGSPGSPNPMDVVITAHSNLSAMCSEFVSACAAGSAVSLVASTFLIPTAGFDRGLLTAIAGQATGRGLIVACSVTCKDTSPPDGAVVAPALASRRELPAPQAGSEALSLAVCLAAPQSLEMIYGSAIIPAANSLNSMLGNSLRDVVSNAHMM